MSLKEKTFSAIRWTTAAMVVKVGLQLLQVAILARLLAPEDFGLMALVLAIIAFTQIFSDLGLGSAIIHYQEMGKEALSSLYWTNILAGIVLMSAVTVMSPFVALVYDEPQLQSLLISISFFFPLLAIGYQLRVVAEKNLLFSRLAFIEIMGSITGLLAAVYVAFVGGGVYALVVGMLSATATISLLSWVLLAHGWRPMLRLRFSDIKQYLNFGMYMMGNNLVNTLNQQADIFLGGRFLSAGALGAYSLSRELSLRVAFVVNPIITRVGFPVMARVQSDKEKLRSIYLSTLRMTTSINFPIYLTFFVFAPEFVGILFGSQWTEAGPLLRILALWGLVRSTGNPVGSLLLAAGKARLSFKWNLVALLIAIPVIWLGAHYGNSGLAVALLTNVLLLSIPQWFFLVGPVCGAKFTEYFKQMLTPLIVAVVASVAGYVATRSIGNDLLKLGGGVTVIGVVYILFSLRVNRPWVEAMKELLFRKAYKA